MRCAGDKDCGAARILVLALVAPIRLSPSRQSHYQLASPIPSRSIPTYLIYITQIPPANPPPTPTSTTTYTTTTKETTSPLLALDPTPRRVRPSQFLSLGLPHQISPKRSARSRCRSCVLAVSVAVITTYHAPRHSLFPNSTFAMSAMVDSYAQFGRLPHRKPLPQSGLQPLTQIHDDPRQVRNRTPSATSPQQPFAYQSPQYHPQMAQYNTTTTTTRRTLSNATTSTSSTNTSTGNSATRRNSDLRRSSSGRSTGSQTSSSYVALMRRQKATVWCDRAQYEDPRLIAQQRAAKMRATMEVVGGNQPPTRTSTSSSGVASGVRAKIRHHGAPKASLYNPTSLASGGVPMRLSASEVDEGDSDNDSNNNNYHFRSGSGRSSLGSGRRIHSYMGPSVARISTSSTPPSAQGSSPTETVAEEPELPSDYAAFGRSGDSSGSELAEPLAAGGSDDLRRRGSVDDRTMTMSGAVRLFVANPDNDSD